MPSGIYIRSVEEKERLRNILLSENKKRMKRVICVCEICNKEFERIPSHIFAHTICSSKCRGKYVSKIQLGKKLNFSEEGMRNLRVTHSGFNSPTKRPEVRKKMSENHYDCYRENNPNWKGGKSFEPYPLGWTRIHKEQIRMRDNYQCKLCGIPEAECNVRLHVHHKDYDKENLKSENLISLCNSCHSKTNFRREYWISYFK
jgi:hypothetical protein